MNRRIARKIVDSVSFGNGASRYSKYQVQRAKARLAKGAKNAA